MSGVAGEGDTAGGGGACGDGDGASGEDGREDGEGEGAGRAERAGGAEGEEAGVHRTSSLETGRIVNECFWLVLICVAL